MHGIAFIGQWSFLLVGLLTIQQAPCGSAKLPYRCKVFCRLNSLGMCGRYTIRRVDMLIRHGAMEAPFFEEFDETKIVPRFNVAPSQAAPIVRVNVPGRWAIDLVTWGLVPHWTKGTPKAKPINARAETVAASGMFRQAFNRRRCLIPADGFYEWKGVKAPKQPMFIHFPDDRLFCFAGLWERWRPEPDVEPIDTFTIITTTANTDMRPIHHRMPVILPEKDYARWLDREVPGEGVADLMRPYDEGLIESYPVSHLVNKPANEGPALVERSIHTAEPSDRGLWPDSDQ